MAWIESHQSLLTHRKTLAAEAMLGITRYQLIGHLHALWWWALDNVPASGDLEGIRNAVLEAAAGWTSDGHPSDGRFVSVLTDAGFITDGHLHNWPWYGGKLQNRREADRERKRGQHLEVPKKSTGHPAETEQSQIGLEPVLRKSSGKAKDVSRRQHNTREDNSTQDNTPPTPSTPRSTTTPLPGDTEGSNLDNTARPRAQGLSKPNVFELYEQTFGQLVPNDIIRQRLEDAEQENGYECVRHCLEETARADVNDWRYTDAILKRHAKEGCYVQADGRLHVKRGPPATEWDAGRGERYLVGKAQALADRTPEEMAADEARERELDVEADRLQAEGAAEREALEGAA